MSVSQFFVPLEKIEHLGFGAVMYLMELKYLTILFLIMSIIQTPAIAFNYLSQQKLSARTPVSSDLAAHSTPPI